MIEVASSRHEGLLERAWTMITLDRLRADGSTRAAAWEEIYAAHFADMHRLIWNCGVTESEAEDLAQRVFVIAYERIHEIQELTTVGGWLRGIALRVVKGHRRWRRVRRVKDWVVRVEAPVPLAAPAPDDVAENRERIEQVRGVLDAMKPKLRDVLALCDLSGLDVAEAAETLGVPVNTVRSRRRLAREQFGRLWRQRYGEHR